MSHFIFTFNLHLHESTSPTRVSATLLFFFGGSGTSTLPSAPALPFASAFTTDSDTDVVEVDGVSAGPETGVDVVVSVTLVVAFPATSGIETRPPLLTVPRTGVPEADADAPDVGLSGLGNGALRFIGVVVCDVGICDDDECE